MKKLIVTSIMLMGAAAMGLGETDAHLKPILSVVSTSSNSVTLQLQAGSQPTRYGFDVSWQSNTGPKRTLSISSDGPECAQYSLQPGQISPPFTIDGITDDDCIAYDAAQPLSCATPYRFFAKLHVYETVSTGVTVLTLPCD